MGALWSSTTASAAATLPAKGDPPSVVSLCRTYYEKRRDEVDTTKENDLWKEYDQNGESDSETRIAQRDEELRKALYKKVGELKQASAAPTDTVSTRQVEELHRAVFTLFCKLSALWCFYTTTDVPFMESWSESVGRLGSRYEKEGAYSKAEALHMGWLGMAHDSYLSYYYSHSQQMKLCADGLVRLAAVYQLQGEYPTAVRALQEALSYRQKQHENDVNHPDIQRTNDLLSRLLQAQAATSVFISCVRAETGAAALNIFTDLGPNNCQLRSKMKDDSAAAREHAIQHSPAVICLLSPSFWTRNTEELAWIRKYNKQVITVYQTGCNLSSVLQSAPAEWKFLADKQCIELNISATRRLQVGLQDIEAALHKAIPKKEFFISHVQREANEPALQIYNWLGKHRCWLDVKMPECGKEAMQAGVENCQVFVCLQSPGYAKSKWCQMELEWARKSNKRIVYAHVPGWHPHGNGGSKGASSLEIDCASPDKREECMRALQDAMIRV